MNYDEYIEELRKYSGDEVVVRLVSHLINWKSDDTNVVELANSIERYFGNTWIIDEETQSHLYKLWASFSATAISGIGGMTMNERLYWFGLLKLYESATETGQQVIYAKLCVNT